MTLIGNDLFADTGGTGTPLQKALIDHVSDSGHAWISNVSGSTDGANTGLKILTDTDEMTGNSAGNAYQFAQLQLNPPTANYKVRMRLTVDSTADFTAKGPMARVSGTSTNNGYALVIDPNDEVFRLERVDNGARTPIGTPSQADVDLTVLPATFVLDVEVIGDQIKGYVDGVEVLSATDGTHAAVGKPGFYARYVTNLTDLSADLYEVYSIDSGPSIDSIGVDDSVLPGEQVTIEMSGDIGATQGTVSLRNAAGSYSVGQTIDQWNQGDSETTGNIVITVSQGGLAFASDHQVTVTPSGGSALTLSPVQIDVPEGHDTVIVSGPVTDSTSIFYQVQSGTPADGQQIEWDDAGNTVVRADGTFKQTVARSFQARVRDLDNIWSAWQTVTVSSDGKLVAGSPNAIVDTDLAQLTHLFDNWAFYNKDPRIKEGDSAVVVHASGTGFQVTSGTGEMPVNLSPGLSGVLALWDNNNGLHVQMSVSVSENA